MSILNTIFYIVLGSLITLLALTIMVLRTKLSETRKEVLNELVDKEILLERLSEALKLLEEKPLEQTEGFLKFITESRDYAFNFIETMQTAILEFENDTKEVFQKQRLSADLKQVKQAYENLKQKTLPKDIPNN